MVVQVTRHHFLASAGLAEDQHAGVGVGHLLHHLPHVLDGTAGTDQAAEQVGLALATALAGLVIHLAIDLGTVQRIEQLAVAWRHLQVGEHTTTQVLRELRGRNFTQKQHRQELIPPSHCLKEPQHAGWCIYGPDQDAQHFTAGRQTFDHLLPVLAGARKVFFAEKIQDHRQIAAAFAVVIDQENLGFTPHAIATSLVISAPEGVHDIIPTEWSVFGRLNFENSH